MNLQNQYVMKMKLAAWLSCVLTGFLVLFSRQAHAQCGNVSAYVPSVSARTVCGGSTVTLSAYGIAPKRWIYRDNHTGNWLTLTTGSNVQTTTNTYSPALTTVRTYRAVVSTPSCPSDTTAGVDVTFTPITYGVNDAIRISASTYTACTNNPATLNLMGTNGTVMRWIYRNEGNTTWNVFTSGNSESVSDYNTSVSEPVQRSYKALVQAAGSCRVDSSDEIKIRLVPLDGGINPLYRPTASATSLCEGSTISMSLDVSHQAIQNWIYRDSANGAWQPFGYGTASPSVVASGVKGVTTRVFRALVKNACRLDSSADLSVTITPANRRVSEAITPRLSGSSTSICAGSSFSVQISGYSSSNILGWIYRDSTDGAWQLNSTSSSSPSFSTPSGLNRDITREVRVIINNASVSCTIDTSAPVFMQVKANKRGNTTAFMPFIPVETVLTGEPVSVRIQASNVSVQWLRRTNNTGSWQVAGSGSSYTDNSTNFTVNTSRSYRAIITSSVNCTADTTTEAVAQVIQPGAGRTVPLTPRMNAAGYCTGTTPSGSISTSYYSIARWVYRDNHTGPWITLPSQTSTTFYDYSASGITVPVTRSYRALLRNTEELTLDSSEEVSTLISPVSRGTMNNLVPQPASYVNCAGKSLPLQVNMPDGYSVQNWIYRDSTVGNWLYLSGSSASVTDFNTNVLYNRTRYYRVIFYNSSICRYDTSGTVSVALQVKARGNNPAIVPQITSGSALMCSNSSNLSLNVSIGSNTTIQRWIVRDNGGPWVAASNTTTSTSYTEQSYNLVVFVPTTREYKVVLDDHNTCSSDTSGAVAITLSPLTGGTVTAVTPTTSAATLCESGNATLSISSGNVQTWIYRDNGAEWAPLNQSSTSLYVGNQKVSIPTSREYRAIIYREGSCLVDTTQSVTVNLYPSVSGNAGTLMPVVNNASVCAGNILTASVTVNTGSQVKKWIYRDNNSGAWLDYPNSTSGSNLADQSTHVASTTQRSVRVIVQQGLCSFDTSSAVTIGIHPVLYGNQPMAVPASSSGSVCSGATVNLSLSGLNGSVKRWIYRDNNGPWLDIPSSSSSFLNHTNTSADVVTTRSYRALITGGSTFCSIDSSAIYSITINPVSYGNIGSITPSASSQNICALASSSATLNVSVPANHTVMKWLMSDNNGPWTDFPYQTGSSSLNDYGIHVAGGTVRNYRVILLNNLTCSYDSSSWATVTINPPLAGNINTVTPASLKGSYCFGSSFTVSTSIPSGYSIRKWMVKDNNDNWRDWESTTTSSQITENNTGVESTTTRYYRVIFSNNTSCATDSSAALAILLHPRTGQAGTINLAPTTGRSTICAGGNAQLSFTGSSTSQVQKWIYSDNGAAGPWHDMRTGYASGSVSHSNTLVSQPVARLYRVILVDTAGCDMDTTNALTMNINPVVPGLDTSRIINGLDTVCAGQTVSLSTSAGSGNSIVKWIYKNNNGPWMDFTNTTTSSSLNDNANNFLGTLNNRSYRVIVLNGNTCSADSSRVRTVNFKQKVYGSRVQAVNVTSGDTVCSGSVIYVNTSGSVEKWLYRDGNAPWNEISTASTFLSHTNTLVNGAVWRYYRAILVNSSNCTADSSSIDSVLIRNQQYGNDHSIVPTTAQATYCANSTITVNAALPQGASFVKWIYRNGSSPWQDLSYSQNGIDYNTQIVANTTRSYRMIFARNCSNDTTAAVTVSINLRTNQTNTSLIPTVQSASVCAGSPVNNISVNAGTGNSIIKWLYRDNNGAWTDLYNGNRNNLTDYNTYFGTTVNRQYRAVINNNTSCSYDTTGSLTVTINPLTVGSTFAAAPTAPATVCAGEPVTVSINPGSGNQLLGWVYNINGGAYMRWAYTSTTNITDYSSGYNTATTRSYRAVVYQPAVCRIDTTDPATVSFVPRTYGNDAAIVPTGSSTLCYGLSIVLNVNPGSGNSVQKWIYRDDPSGNWIETGYNSNTLSMSNNSQAQVSRTVRALIVKGAQCSIDTSAALVVDMKPRVYAQSTTVKVSSDSLVCTGASFTVSAPAVPGIQYWLYRDNGGSWNYIYSTGSSITAPNTVVNATVSREYTLLSLDAATCMVDTAISDTTIITIRSNGNDNGITPTVNNSSVCTGTSLTLNVNPGTGNAVQRWIYMDNNDGNWKTLVNGNYSSYTDYNTNVASTTVRTYRAVITKTGNCSNDSSAAVSATISPRAVGSDLSIVPSSSSGSYCSGSYYTVSLNMSSSHSVLKWLLSTNNGPWTELYQGNTRSISQYAQVSSATTRSYRALIIKGSGCSIDTSAAFTVSLNPAGYGNQHTVAPNGTASVCAGNPVTLAVSGYTGNAVLRWLYRDNMSGPWNEWYVSSATLSDYNTAVQSSTVRSYRALVNNPAGCSVDTTGIFNVSISPVVNGVSSMAAQASQSSYCSGNPVNLFINPAQGYQVVQWLKLGENGTWELLANTQAASVFDYNTEVSANSTRSYRAILRNAAACSFDSSGIVHVNLRVITAGNNNTLVPSTGTPSVCSGNTAVVSIAGFSGNVLGWLYRDTTFGSWFAASGSGSTLLDNNTYTSYDKTRYYRAIVYNSSNCSYDTTAELAIRLNRQLAGNAPAITPTASANDVCSGTSVTLRVSGLINGGVVSGWAYSDNGSTWVMIANSASANYTHTATSVGSATVRSYRALVLTGCSLDSTAILSISIDVPLPKPQVSNPQGSDSLVCDIDAVSYRWRLAGNLISGATSKVYRPTESGSYTVEVTNAAGCVTLSDAFIYTHTGLRKPAGSAAAVNLYPNPTTNGNLNLEVQGISPGEVEIMLTDMAGRLVHAERRTVSSGSLEMTFDLGRESGGVYFITLVSGDERITRKVVYTK